MSLNARQGSLAGYLSASYTAGRVDSLAGRGLRQLGDPPNISTFLLKGGFSWEIVDNFSVDLRCFYCSVPNIEFSAIDFPFVTPLSSTINIDANVRYRLILPAEQGAISFFISGLNLTNTHYRVGSGRPSVNPPGTGQPPLSVLLGANVEFAGPNLN